MRGSFFARLTFTLTTYLLMLQAWTGYIRGIDQPNWSLSVETFFYLVFPLLGVFLWKMRGNYVWMSAAIVWITGQLVILFAPQGINMRYNPIPHAFTFALGILLAKWQCLQQERQRHPRKNSGVIAMVLLLSFSIFAATVYWEPSIPLLNLNAGLLSPVFCAILWACSGNQSFPARLLSAKWLVVLGEASFGLYLIHIPVSHLFELLHWQHSRALYPVYLATCIGLSVLSFYFFEAPSRKWILSRFHTRPKETLEAASSAQ